MTSLNNSLKQYEKRFFRFTNWLAIFAASGAFGAENTSPSAKVLSIAGCARFASGAEFLWKPVKVGEYLSTGAVIQTCNESGTMADLALFASQHAAGPTFRIYSNSVLKLLKLESTNSSLTQIRDIGLEVTAGKIRVIHDGSQRCDFEFNAIRVPMHLTIEGSTNSPQATVFISDGHGTLTVLKGEVKATEGSKPEKVVRSGEQLRANADDITKLAPDAPEWKLFP